MPLEAGDGFISGLTITNPVGATDPKSQGDDHIRLIKAALKGTFPNLNAAVTPAPAELNILDGATLSTAELNILDGVTASAAELNILDGATLSTAELNILDGVTLTASQINDAAQLSATNTFTAQTNYFQSANPFIRFDQTTGAADNTLWDMGVVSETFQMRVLNDAENSSQTFMTVNRTAQTIDSIALAATSITLNGVAASDFARLSQSNTFTGTTQTISAGSAFFIASASGNATTQLGSFSTIGFVGTTTAHTLSLYSNNTARLDISSAGNFDFKGGTVTTNDASASEVGFKGAPSSDVSASVSTAASSAGRTVRFTGGAGQTFTLDSDPPEDSIVVLDNNSGNSWTIAASGTLTWAATGGTGSRTLANDGMAVALHRGSGNWIINGGGLT